MAIDGNLPLFLENVGKVWHARQYRRMLEALFIGPGVLGDDDLTVTPSSPGAMSVDVASGTGLVRSTTGTDQGFYLVRNSAAVLDVLIDPSDPTDDRFDLLVLHILDSEHDGGVLNNGADNPVIDVIAGTPDASPADPTVPDNCEVLARVHVEAGATTITTVDDLRRRAPHEFQQKNSLTWTAHTADFDMGSWTVPTTPLDYDIVVRPEVAIAFLVNDADAWDVTFSIGTAAAGLGVILGKGGQHNPGNGLRRQMVIPCDELVIFAGDQTTLFLHAAYGGATPSAGFVPSSVGERVVRTQIRPARG